MFVEYIFFVLGGGGAGARLLVVRWVWVMTVYVGRVLVPLVAANALVALVVILPSSFSILSYGWW